MKYIPLVWAALTRKPARAVLTLLAMTVAFMLVGLVPLSAGVFDWCIISALLGGPLSGARVNGGS